MTTTITIPIKSADDLFNEGGGQGGVQLATTQLPVVAGGSASVGVETVAARADHRHPPQPNPTPAQIGAANVVHGHAIADIAGLQSSLDALNAALSGGFAPLAHVGSGGNAHATANTSAAGFMSSSDKTKLDSVETNATANATDASLRDRTTHTGSQPIASVTGLQTALDDRQPINDQLSSIAAITYGGNALKVLRINAAETAIEVATPSSGGGTPDFILQSLGIT